MPFRFNCESCDVRIKVPDGAQGKKVKCPSCGHAQRVPGTATPVAAAVAAPPPRTVAKQPVAATSATPPRIAEKPAPVETPKAKATPGPKARREPERTEPPVAPHREPDDALSALAAAAAAEAPTVAAPPLKPTIEPSAATRESVKSKAGGKSKLSTSPPALADAKEPKPDPVAAMPLAEPENPDALRAFLTSTESHIDVNSLSGDVDDKATIPQETTPPAKAASVIHVDMTAERAPIVEVSSTEPESAVAREAQPARDGADSPVTPMSTSMDALFGAESQASASFSEEQQSSSSPVSSQEEDGDPVDEESSTRSAFASEAGEAPAGEVRDLFDDFVRRESIVREAESKNQESHEMAAMEPAPEAMAEATPGSVQSNADGPEESEPAFEPVPVTVTKTPPKILRGGRIVGKGPMPAPSTTDDVEDTETRTAAPVAAVHSGRAPQAIALSSPDAPSAVAAAVGSMSPATHAEPMADAPVAKARRATPSPGYSLLLVLCWTLRLLACLSLISVVKLTLMALDAGAKPLDVAIVAPFGLGLVAAIWTVGEVARVTRDSARNSHR